MRAAALPKGALSPALFSLACGLAGQYLLYAQKAVLPGLLLLAAAAAVFIYADTLQKKPVGQEPLGLKKEALFLALILVAGIFFRSYRLAQMPPGCFVDEGFVGLDIMDVLKGSLPLYVGVPTDNPAVFLYFGAAVFKFFGAGAQQLRAVSVVLGILAIPAFYFLLRYLFGAASALCGAFLFSVMKWHVWFSRMGLHTILSVLVFMSLLYFCARAYREGKWPDFALAGAMAGFSQYTYTAARLLPLWLVLALVFVFFREKSFIAANWKKITAAALLAAAISIPIALFALNKPDVFFRRQKEISIFTKTTFDAHFRGKTALQVMLDNAKNTALMFNYRGDTEARYNIPGEPMLDFFTGMAALIGFACLLLNAFSVGNFVIITAFLAILSSNVITESSPNACRSLMAAPLCIMFAVVYISKLSRIISLSVKSAAVKRAFLGAGLAALACAGLMNYGAYFNRAAANPEVWSGFDTDAYDAARYYASKDAGWSAYASIQAWKKRSFDFTAATGNKYPYDTFRIEEAVPAISKNGENRVYILSPHYTSLIDPVFKVLYPGGRLITFHNPFDLNRPAYFAYEIPYQEIKNLEKAGYKNGLTMRLYTTKDWSGPLKNEKIVPAVFLDQDFGTYSWIWTGKIKAPKSGDYGFSLHSVGYGGLVIDGKQVLENQGYNRGRQETSGRIKLAAGLHAIKVKYCQGQELAKIEMRWTVPGKAREVVPVNVLFPE